MQSLSRPLPCDRSRGRTRAAPGHRLPGLVPGCRNIRAKQPLSRVDEGGEIGRMVVLLGRNRSVVTATPTREKLHANNSRGVVRQRRTAVRIHISTKKCWGDHTESQSKARGNPETSRRLGVLLP